MAKDQEPRQHVQFELPTIIKHSHIKFECHQCLVIPETKATEISRMLYSIFVNLNNQYNNEYFKKLI